MLRGSADRLVVKTNQIVSAERRERVGVALAIDELDFRVERGIYLDHRANLAALQALLGKITEQRHGGEKFKISHSRQPPKRYNR